MLREQLRTRVPWAYRNRRKNAGFVRQGEWFFTPADSVPHLKGLTIKYRAALPLLDPAGSAHICDELLFLPPSARERTTVERAPATFELLDSLQRSNATFGDSDENILAAFDDRRSVVRVYRTVRQHQPERLLVRGCVRHRDHKKLILSDWHVAHMAALRTVNETTTEFGVPQVAVIRYID